MRFVRVLAAVPLVAFAGSAQAAPAYVGTWASSPAQCKLGQSAENAPVVMKPKGYDQHEAHCTFTSVITTARDTWRVKGTCTVEGDKQSLSMTLSVKGDVLTMRDTGIRRLQRCK